MTRDGTAAAGLPQPAMGEAFEEMTASFERFCLAAGLEALGEMMEADAEALCGARHGRDAGRRAHRWGRTVGPIAFHGGKIAAARPRVRERGGCANAGARKCPCRAGSGRRTRTGSADGR